MSEEKEAIIDVETIHNEQNNLNIDTQTNSFDFNVILNITGKVFSIFSIIAAYLGVFIILSYPIIHTINFFCNIDEFMKKLPIGYTAQITSLSSLNIPFLEKSAMVFFGIICLFIALKICAWLMECHSVLSRIFCIFLGSGFMYLMVSKEANDIMLNGYSYVVLIIFAILFGIPLFFLCCKCTPFGAFTPSIAGYYRFIFSLLPSTSKLSEACDSAIKSKENRQIKYAKQSGSYVEVIYDNGTKSRYMGDLVNYTSQSVTFYSNNGTGWYYTYDVTGNKIDSVAKSDWKRRH